MLKVIVDSTPVLPKPSGVGLYVKNLLLALQALSVTEDFELETLYQPSFRAWALGADEPRHELPPEINAQRINLPVRLSSRLWEMTGQPLGAWRKPSSRLKAGIADTLDQCLGFPDIIHGTNYAVPPSHRARTVLNIYDLTFVRYPEYADAMAKTYEARVRHCLQWTDLVLTVSESSKRDIIQYLNVEADRIWVTPLASQYQPLQAHQEPDLSSERLSLQSLSPGNRFPEHGSPEDWSSEHQSSEHRSSEHRSSKHCFSGNLPARTLSVQSQKKPLDSPTVYDLKRPFLLFVSTIEPRKNITNLIKSFNILKSCHRIDHDLVLIGKKGWSYGPIFEEIARSPWRSQIFHLDYLPDHQVQQFYRHAQAFIYPSHYEGFGLPVLEAMTFGVPVVTANTSSLPEVGGPAAIYVDPQDPEAIATQVYRVLADSALRQSLAIQGQQQAKKFSWEATARETLRAYRSLR